MKKQSKLKDAKRFHQVVPLADGRTVRLWIRDDGVAAKITHSDDLTPEELDTVADWLKKLARDLKKIREDGPSNGTGRALFARKP